MISCTSSFLTGFFAWKQSGEGEREREKKKNRRRHVALRSTAQIIFTDPLLRIRMLLISVNWICTGSKQTSYLRKHLCVPQACVALKSLQCTRTCRFQALSTAVERSTSTCEVEKQRCRKLAAARELQVLLQVFPNKIHIYNIHVYRKSMI